MRVAVIGDCDTYFIRGQERPRELLPYHGLAILNTLRGFRELGVKELHLVVVSSEVNEPHVEPGPYGVVHRVPCPKFSGTGSFHLWRRHIVLRELRAIQPDVVHGHGTEREYAFIAVTSPYRHVITFHGMMHRVHEVVPPSLVSPGHVPRWLEKLVVRKAREIICVTPAVEEFVRSRGGQGRCHLVPNAIASCFFEVQKRESTGPQLSLLFVGTVYPLKGLLQLVEALPVINGALGRPVLLRVVGQFSPTDSYVQQVRQRARELGVESSVEWLGVLYEQEIADLLSRTDVLVLPSFEESYGMCLAEAMAAGVPVVGSRVGGVPYVVDDGVNGLLVSPGKTDEIAQASIKLLKDAGLRQRMGVAGRVKAQAQYTPRAVAEKLWSVYERIAHESR